jgi:succinate-acetate transporter protein
MSDSHATANPAGLIVMVFYLCALLPVLIGIAPASALIILVPLGLVGSIVQFIAGAIELKRGDVVNGNITLAFSAFMFYGAISFMFKFLNIGPQDTSLVDGWVFLSMGVIMLFLTGLPMRAGFIPGLFFIITDIFFGLMGFGNLLGMPALTKAAGYIEIIAVISLIWIIVATILNTAYGKEVVSLGPPWIKTVPQKEGVSA